LRGVALKIKNQGMDIESFAPLVRLHAVLRDKGILTGITGEENLLLMQDRLEAAIVNMEVILFQKGLSTEHFFSLVTNMYNFADRVGVPLSEFPSYIEELKDRIDVLRKEINQAEKKKQDFQNDHKKTLELLQKYVSKIPYLLTVENLEEQLANAEEQLRDAKGRIRELEELQNKRCTNDLGEQNMGSLFETELDKAKEKFLPVAEIPRSMSMIKDALKNPQRYMGVLRRMREHYEGYQSLNSS
jgi:vacuolar-type H+-ATPase subunit I/STV1